MPYLTPNSVPTDKICRALFIPNDENFIAIVTGALEELTYAYNFEEYGALTPQQTADVFQIMFDDFCLKREECRVIGEIISFAGNTSPKNNWLLCDGASLLRADYPDLFNVIGVTYGTVDSNHFNIPDLRGRVAVGSGNGSGLTSRAIGQAFGEESHQLTGLELASHSHTDSGHSHVEGNAAPTVGAAITGVPVPSAVPSVGSTGLGFAAISSSGGDNPHNNIQPSLVINFLIVAANDE